MGMRRRWAAGIRVHAQLERNRLQNLHHAVSHCHAEDLYATGMGMSQSSTAVISLRIANNVLPQAVNMFLSLSKTIVGLT